MASSSPSCASLRTHRGRHADRQQASSHASFPTRTPLPQPATSSRSASDSASMCGTRHGLVCYVVDGARARIILGMLVTPAEVQENQPALDLLWRARFRWRLQPHQITGDTKYATTENLAAIEGQAIRAYVPLSEVG
jgi:hypothetical protein